MDCKYCEKHFRKSGKHQVMCRQCRKIYKVEYDRLYKLLRKDVKTFGTFVKYQCPFCARDVLGRRVCRECTRIRQVISESLTRELEINIHGKHLC